MTNEHPVIIMFGKRENGDPGKKVPDHFIRITGDHGILFEIRDDYKSMDVSVVRMNPSVAGSLECISKLLNMPLDLIKNYIESFVIVKELIIDLSEKSSEKGN
jgi:hypothetical protein